jgi:hypothetical protein
MSVIQTPIAWIRQSDRLVLDQSQVIYFPLAHHHRQVVVAVAIAVELGVLLVVRNDALGI